MGAAPNSDEHRRLAISRCFMTVVLVVDDSPDVLEILGAMLEGAGYTAILTQQPKRAIELTGEVLFDVALCDIFLPHEADDETRSSDAGIQLIARLRSRFPRLPVVAMSGNIESVDREARRAAGVKEVLSKPFNRAALIEKLEAALRSAA